MSNIEQRMINKDNSEFLRNPYQAISVPTFPWRKFSRKIVVYKIRVAIRLDKPMGFSRWQRAARTTWWSMRRTMPCWPTLGCPRCRWKRCFCWRARNNSSWNLKKNCDSIFIDYISCICIHTIYMQYIHHNIYIYVYKISTIYIIYLIYHLFLVHPCPTYYRHLMHRRFSRRVWVNVAPNPSAARSPFWHPRSCIAKAQLG